MDQVTFFEAEYQIKKRKTRCGLTTLYTDLLCLAEAYIRHSSGPPLQKHDTQQGRCCLFFVRSRHSCTILVQKTGTDVGCPGEEESFKRSSSVFFHIFQCQSGMSEYF